MRMKLGVTLGYAILIWVIGFVWGTVVFMVPALKGIPSIPMFSRYPLISFPLLILFPVMAYCFAPKCVDRSAGASSIPPVGFVFSGVNIVLDYLVLVLAFKAGAEYFYFLSIWIAYAAIVVTSQMSLKRFVTSRGT